MGNGLDRYWRLLIKIVRILFAKIKMKNQIFWNIKCLITFNIHLKKRLSNR